IVIGIVVFAVMYGLLHMQASTHRRYQNKILHRLTEMELTPSLSQAVFNKDSDKLIEDKLNQLSQKLYRLETVRKSMVADVAHELRTPLSIMRAQIDNALYNQADIEPSQAALLQAEVYRMSKLLGDLQQLALAESGHLLLNQTWFPLQPFLAAIVDAFTIDAEEKNIAVLLNCSSPFRVYADEDRLRQVFVNLIGNALRFARSRIEITVKLESPDYVITVTDDGMGIEAEDLPYIFERFYSGVVKRREPASTSSSGLGLGLPIVKQWIETHKGTVRVSSRWNEGTVFHVQLPVFYEQRLS
ncbi:MAG: two-component system sensor histidine kinase, partial [Paenibacillus sp.]|nr:two-component system sensor histidine kinase [Paenibacillus sp.]